MVRAKEGSRALPPCEDESRLIAALRLVPSALRDDAAQESWAAFLDGKDPVRAVDNFRLRERLHVRRERTNTLDQ